MITKYLVVIFLKFTAIYGANFLFLSGIASPSHHLWNFALIKGLAANKSHNITVISADIETDLPSNIHFIHLEKTYESMFQTSEESLDLVEFSVENPYLSAPGLYQWSYLNCEGNLKSKGLDIILNYPDDFKFDVVVHDFLCGDCLLPLLHKFKYPALVAISAFDSPEFMDEFVGGHRYPGYVPHYGSKYDSHMNFFERLNNFLVYQWDHLYRTYYFLPKFEKLMQDGFKSIKNLPPLSELRKKTVLMLINRSPALSVSKPIDPNVIYVGGLQLVEAKPLKEDLKKFVESGVKGTVLMSLGTNMRSDLLGKETLIHILKAFKAIPDYNFVWKFESDSLPNEKPKNVMISKFLPQKDILAHSNVKAFISHCGLMSTQEAFWYGKPVVGIPFFGDQYRNMENFIRLGAGVRMNFRLITAETFKEKILEVLNNPKYTKNAQVVAKNFQDIPEKPLKTAVWWLEYIVRNPNPKHLQSPTMQIGFLAANSYDVIGFIALVLGLFLTLAVKVGRYLLKCRKSVTNDKKTK